MDISLFDQNNIAQLKWPETPEGRDAHSLFLPMLQEGVDKYIHNVETKLYLLKCGDHLIPLTVNEKEYNNSYLTSNYFPIKYIAEKMSQKFPYFLRVQGALIEGVGALLKSVKINKVVIVNNWLLTTNLYPNLTAEETAKITTFLISRFPRHALIFRSLNRYDYAAITTYLEIQKYRFFKSRLIYFYTPSEKQNFSSKVIYHHRRDRRLIEQEGYEIVRPEKLNLREVERLIELYTIVYVSHHTKYSPHYSKEYLTQAVEKRILKMIGLKKGGKFYGIMGCYVRNGTMTIPFFGYDPAQGQSNHLYRMMTILAIEEAEKENVALNDGSGGEGPKKFRGMKPFQEYVAVYDRHLPFYRRLFWSSAEKLCRLFTSGSSQP